MALITNSSTWTPKDNQDILVEDLENLINSTQAEIGDRTTIVDGTGTGNGIVTGMEVSYSSPNIVVAAGTVFNNGSRGETTTATNILLSSVTLNDYIVARIVYTDTDARANPITGVSETMERVYSCTITNVTAGSYDPNTETILTKVTNIVTPLFGDLAGWSYAQSGVTLSLSPADASGNLIYGDLGNKYYVVFEVEASSTLNVVQTTEPSGLGYEFLRVRLAGDTAGNVTSTFAQIRDAINAVTLKFVASLTGSPTSVIPTNIVSAAPNYTAFTSGNSYRTYYSVVTGSAALNIVPRFSATDPFSTHISEKGHGIPTTTNPHALTLEDLDIRGVDMVDHIREEHYEYASILRLDTEGFLATSINNLNCSISAGISSDVCIIGGRTYGFSSSYTLAGTSSSFNLYEFLVNNAGNIANRVVATYDSTTAVPTYSPIQNGDHAVLSIIDKYKYLSGGKLLRLVVSGGGTVFNAYYGANTTPVDVSVVGEYLLFDDSDNTWIKIWRELETMVDGDYRNTVTYTSYDDVSELPISMVFWKGDQDEWGYNGAQEEWIDKRQYGSFNALHEKNRVGAKNGRAKLTENLYAGFLTYITGNNTLYVNPFEIEYRGTRYRNATQQTFSVGTVALPHYSFLVATFDERNLMTLDIQTTPTFNGNTVILGVILTDATPVITGLDSCYYPGSYSTVKDTLYFEVGTETEFWNSLETLSVLKNATRYRQGIISIQADFYLNQDNQISTTALSEITILGNGHRLDYSKGTQAPLNVTTNFNIENLLLYGDGTLFMSTAQLTAITNCKFISSSTTEALIVQSSRQLAVADSLWYGVVEATSVNTLASFENCSIAASAEVGMEGNLSFVNCNFESLVSTLPVLNYAATTSTWNATFSNCTMSLSGGDLLPAGSGRNGEVFLDNCILGNLDIVNNGGINLTLTDCTSTSSTDLTTTADSLSIKGGVIDKVTLNGALDKANITDCEIISTIAVLEPTILSLSGVCYKSTTSTDALITSSLGATETLTVLLNNTVITQNNMGLVKGTGIIKVKGSNNILQRTTAATHTLTCDLNFALSDSDLINHHYTLTATNSSLRMTGGKISTYFKRTSSTIRNHVISLIGTELDYTGLTFPDFGNGSVSWTNCNIPSLGTGAFGTPPTSLKLTIDNCTFPQVAAVNFNWATAGDLWLNIRNMELTEIAFTINTANFYYNYENITAVDCSHAVTLNTNTKISLNNSTFTSSKVHGQWFDCSSGSGLHFSANNSTFNLSKGYADLLSAWQCSAIFDGCEGVPAHSKLFGTASTLTITNCIWGKDSSNFYDFELYDMNTVYIDSSQFYKASGSLIATASSGYEVFLQADNSYFEITAGAQLLAGSTWTTLTFSECEMLFNVTGSLYDRGEVTVDLNNCQVKNSTNLFPFAVAADNTYITFNDCKLTDVYSTLVNAQIVEWNFNSCKITDCSINLDYTTGTSQIDINMNDCILTEKFCLLTPMVAASLLMQKSKRLIQSMQNGISVWTDALQT